MQLSFIFHFVFQKSANTNLSSRSVVFTTYKAQTSKGVQQMATDQNGYHVSGTRTFCPDSDCETKQCITPCGPIPQKL